MYTLLRKSGPRIMWTHNLRVESLCYMKMLSSESLFIQADSAEISII